MKKLLILAAFLCGSIVYPLPAPAADAAHGKALYRTYCTQCHGLSGDGKGVNAKQLSVQPRNHQDRAEMSARTDADLFKAIKEGGQAVNKSILMPNWDGNMTDDEIHDVVAYLRELCCAGAK
ncbi:MAG: cytochrome C class I [Rhodospirillaceae bacterium]|nr:cytochrome C class I [Rhodospirillaceae bacterium]